jgi:hypothetical protein
MMVGHVVALRTAKPEIGVMAKTKDENVVVLRTGT